MLAGHFGIAAAVKSKAPGLPLWALLVSTQLYDIVFVALNMLKLETIEGSGYGEAIIHAFYSHSLLVAVLLALVAGWLTSRRWGRSHGFLIAAVVFSHWLLDLIVHRPDLPLLPGNLDTENGECRHIRRIMKSKCVEETGYEEIGVRFDARSISGGVF